MSGDKYPYIFSRQMEAIVFIILQIFFFTRPHFGRPFLKAFKRQKNSVSAQNIISLFKVFSFIHFNNLLGIKAKRANVDRKVRKLGNIT